VESYPVGTPVDDTINGKYPLIGIPLPPLDGIGKYVEKLLILLYYYYRVGLELDEGKVSSEGQSLSFCLYV